MHSCLVYLHARPIWKENTTCKNTCFPEPQFPHLMTVLVSKLLCLQIRDAVVFTEGAEWLEKAFPQSVGNSFSQHTPVERRRCSAPAGGGPHRTEAGPALSRPPSWSKGRPVCKINKSVLQCVRWCSKQGRRAVRVRVGLKFQVRRAGKGLLEKVFWVKIRRKWMSRPSRRKRAVDHIEEREEGAPGAQR